MTTNHNFIYNGKQASKQRIGWIDFGKGRAIFLVVLGHVFLGLYQSGRFHSSEYWLWILIEGIYIFHMPVFFALSGTFLNQSRRWLVM